MQPEDKDIDRSSGVDAEPEKENFETYLSAMQFPPTEDLLEIEASLAELTEFVRLGARLLSEADAKALQEALILDRQQRIGHLLPARSHQALKNNRELLHRLRHLEASLAQLEKSLSLSSGDRHLLH